MKLEAGLLSRQCAQRHGSAVALSDRSRNLTFSELNEAANRVGSGLLAAGAERGDRIGVLAHNTAEVVETWLGLEAHNLVRVVLHTHIEADAHAWSLDHVGATALLFDTRQTEVVEAIRAKSETGRAFVAIGPDAPGWATPYEEIKANGDPADPFVDVDEDAPNFLQLTSGTTGRPKPWVKTYGSWRAVIDQNVHHLDTFGPAAPPLGSRDVNLHFHPIQWASGFQTLYPYLLRGARSVLMDDAEFDPRALVDSVVGERVTGMLMPAPLLPAVLDEVEARGGIDHDLRRLVIFFGTPELLERTTAVLGPVWCHGFGSTEQGAPTTRLLASEVAANPARIGSVGRGAGPFFDVAILDPDGRRLPAGEIGEIAVRSAMSMGEYWGLPDATAAAFFPGDWFRPRDIGYLDDDGFLYYADRAGDEIRTRGAIVYPHYVEVAILGHPEVANCGVVGVGDDAAEQEVVAAVLLKNGSGGSPELERAILDRVSADEHLSEADRPARCVFVNELPTVLGGAKVQRSALRTRLMERV